MRTFVIFLNKLILRLAKHWEPAANTLFGAMLVAAVLAPGLSAAGFEDAGGRFYRLLAPHDHQLPQRSYFLFSPTGGVVESYSLEQILDWKADPDNLRAFTGNREIGFKMALNHRMTAIFIGLFLGGLLWSSTFFQPKMNRLRLALVAFPMMLDALSHLVTERTGLPIRLGNAWAVWLTAGSLPPEFYAGTTIGSLDWALRTITGLLFGLGTVWYLFPYFERQFTDIRQQVEPKLRRIGAIN